MSRAPRWLVVLTLAVLAGPAAAEPLRLRGDALASAASPVGLLVLSGDGGLAHDGLHTVSAEAMVWLGADADGVTGDALVMALIARRQDGRAQVRVGRTVVTAGALRPVHLDGVAGRVRLPRRIDVELFGGVPAVPKLGAHAWDWVIGGRAARRLGDSGSAGLALLEQRSQGRLDTRELGLDAAVARGRRDLATRLAIDLIDPTVADVSVVATQRWSAIRAEVSAQHRVPSHLLPATSLFTVLGDVASDRLGGGLRWKAAPRLDLVGDLGVRRIDGATAADGFARATLRLDDAGRGAITGEARRAGAIDGGWTGLRLAARVPRGALTASLEAELVIADVDRGRGRVWPWALAALGWACGPWDAAVAVEASASPAERGRLDVLGQLGRRWELR
ncbi:MAG: hypothetical protein R3B06_06045 [Kofleriaceae bacterium]